MGRPRCTFPNVYDTPEEELKKAKVSTRGKAIKLITLDEVYDRWLWFIRIKSVLGIVYTFGDFAKYQYEKKNYKIV